MFEDLEIYVTSPCFFHLLKKNTSENQSSPKLTNWSHVTSFRKKKSGLAEGEVLWKAGGHPGTWTDGGAALGNGMVSRWSFFLGPGPNPPKKPQWWWCFFGCFPKKDPKKWGPISNLVSCSRTGRTHTHMLQSVFELLFPNIGICDDWGTDWDVEIGMRHWSFQWFSGLKIQSGFSKGDLVWVGSADFGDDFLREGCETTNFWNSGKTWGVSFISMKLRVVVSIEFVAVSKKRYRYLKNRCFFLMLFFWGLLFLSIQTRKKPTTDMPIVRSPWSHPDW